MKGNYSFGTNSKNNLNTCHPDLIKVMEMAIKYSIVDFGISEGHRILERQKQLYDKGLSRIDGVNSKGKHNMTPSMACDIYAYHPDYEMRKKIAYDHSHLAYISGIVNMCSEILYERKEIKHKVKNGGNWDEDGILMYDHNLIDLPHFELI